MLFRPKTLFAAALSMSVFAGVAAADPVKIVYASYVGPKHPTSAAVEEFFKSIETESKGSIDFDWHFGASLLSAKEIPAGVRDGIADSGYMLGIFVPSEMPVDNYIGDFSMINDDALAITGVSNELIIHKCPQCKEEFEKNFKTKYLGSYSLTPYLIQCKDERRKISDFKSVKVRGFSSIAEMIKGFGGVPVGVTTNEMYEALQRGVIDCAIHMLASQKSFSLGETAKYIVTDSLGGFMGGSMLNLRLEKWNQLSLEQRKIIVKHLPKVIATSAFNYLKLDDEVRVEMEGKGNKFYPADPDLAQFIKKFRTDYVDQKIVEKGRERGVKEPEKIKATIMELKAKWTKLLAENGRDQATFEKLLWNEIYSKMDIN